MAGAILAALLVVLTAVVAVLTIPVTLTFRFAWPETAGNEFQLRWVFGLVRLRLPNPISTTPADTAAVDTRPARRVTKRRRRGPKPNPFAALRQRRFRQRVLRLVRDLWRAVDRQDLCLDLRIGTGDPAETGQLWAVLGPISGMLQNLEDGRIRVTPEFVDPLFDVGGSGQLRVIPLRILAIVAGLLLSPPIWRGLRAMRAGG